MTAVTFFAIGRNMVAFGPEFIFLILDNCGLNGVKRIVLEVEGAVGQGCGARGKRGPGAGCERCIAAVKRPIEREIMCVCMCVRARALACVCARARAYLKVR